MKKETAPIFPSLFDAYRKYNMKIESDIYINFKVHLLCSLVTLQRQRIEPFKLTAPIIKSEAYL